MHCSISLRGRTLNCINLIQCTLHCCEERFFRPTKNWHDTMPLRKDVWKQWACDVLVWEVERFQKSWEGWKLETLEANLPTDAWLLFSMRIGFSANKCMISFSPAKPLYQVAAGTTEFLSDFMGIHQATLPQDLVMSAWGPRSRFSSQMSGKGVGLQLMSWLPRIRVKPWMFSWFFHHAALGGFNDGFSIECSTDLDDLGGHPGTHLMKPPCGGFLA